jgi:hypothetical protein
MFFDCRDTLAAQELLEFWRQFHVASIELCSEDRPQESGALFEAEGIRRFAVIGHKRQEA